MNQILIYKQKKTLYRCFVSIEWSFKVDQSEAMCFIQLIMAKPKRVVKLDRITLYVSSLKIIINLKQLSLVSKQPVKKQT